MVSVHNNAVKVWHFTKTKMSSTDMAIGHLKRFINCVTVDPSDTFAYCGTRTGDLLEVYLEKATFKRLGPVNRIFVGGISKIVCSITKDLIVGAGDGSLAKINRKTMAIEE